MDPLTTPMVPETVSDDDEWEEVLSGGRTYRPPETTRKKVADAGMALLKSMWSGVVYPVTRGATVAGPSREETLLNNLKKPFDEEEPKTASYLHINVEHTKILLTMRQTLLKAKTPANKYSLLPRTIGSFRKLVAKHNKTFLPNTYELIKWRQYIQGVKSSLMIYLSSLTRCSQRIHLSLHSGIEEI